MPWEGPGGQGGGGGATTATHGFFLRLTGSQDLGFLPCEVLPSPWEVTGAEPTLVGS